MASLKFLTPNIVKTVTRFPASVLCSICLFILIVTKAVDPDDLAALAYAFIYGFFSFGVARLAAEAHGWAWWKEALLGGALAGFSFFIMGLYAAFAFSMTNMVLLAVFMLAVLTAPFLFRRSDDLSFWYFQQQFTVGFFLALVGALILGGGVSIGLLAIHNLFDVRVPGIYYSHVWSFALLVYAPFNALSWMPERFDVEPAECRAAPGLSFILNWILAPLAILYFVILYAYGLKIIMEWELPRGGVAYLVSGFGALGILFYVSGWALKEEGSILVRFLYRHFFKLLILPVVLLCAGIYVRIDAYGVTVDRYLVVLLAVWFGSMAVLFTLRPQAPVKYLLGSILGLLLMASFGPWGMVSVSDRSQLARMTAILERNAMLENGAAVKAAQAVPVEDEASLSSIVDYFIRNKRRAVLEPIFPAMSHANAHDLMKDLGLNYYRGAYGVAAAKKKAGLSYRAITYNAASRTGGRGSYDVGGYDVLYSAVYLNTREDGSGTAMLGNSGSPQPRPRLVLEGNRVYFEAGESETGDAGGQGQAGEGQRIELDVMTPIAALSGPQGENVSLPLQITGQGRGIRVKFVIESLWLHDYDEGERRIQSLSGYLLVGR
ncbi:MAG: DUF4153 domain-containing protein [Micavibrio sp.]